MLCSMAKKKKKKTNPTIVGNKTVCLTCSALHFKKELKLPYLTPWKKSYDQPRQHIQKPRHYFANKGLSSQGYGFSYGHVWM